MKNIGILAHIDAGKTTTTEAILFNSGKIRAQGNVDDGNTTTDYLEEERKRGITIQGAVTSCIWNNEKINIIDTPGHIDFTMEVERAISVIDGAIIILDSSEGIEAQTKTVWETICKQRNNIEKIIYLNKLDKIGASVEKCLKQIKEKFGLLPLLINSPVIDNNKIVDVKCNLPNLIDDLSTLDDDFLEYVLNNEEVKTEEITKSIKKVIREKKAILVCCGSSAKNIGVKNLLDNVVLFFPSPEENNFLKERTEFSGFIFKVSKLEYGYISYVLVYTGEINKQTKIFNPNKKKKEKIESLHYINGANVENISSATAGEIIAIYGLRFSRTGDTIILENSNIVEVNKIKIPESLVTLTIEIYSNQDEDKLQKCLEQISIEDPSFNYIDNKKTGQTIIKGVGELHLEIILNRLKNEFNLNFRVGKPTVEYKETISFNFTREQEFEGNYIKLEFESNAESISIENNLPIAEELKEYVHENLTNVLVSGNEGFPLDFFKVKVLDIKISNSNWKKNLMGCISLCVFNALREKGTTILEPYSKLEFSCEEEFFGTISSEIFSRKGKIISSDFKDKEIKITAIAPTSQLFGFTSAIRSSTQGKVSYNSYFEGQYEIKDNL